MKTNEKKKNTRRSLLLFFCRGNKRWWLVTVLFALGLTIFDLISPKIIEYTVDSVIGDKEGNIPAFLNAWIAGIGGRDYLRSHFYLVAAAIAIVAVLGAVMRYAFRLTDQIAAEKLTERTRNTLFSHISHLPFSWFSENHTGDIIQRCTSDVENIRMFLSEQLVQLFQTILLIGLSIYFMLGIQVPLALVSAAFIPIVMAASIAFHGFIAPSFMKADEMEGELSSIVQENLTGVRVVRAFGRERYEKDRFEKKNAAYTAHWIRLMGKMSAFWVSGNAISTVKTLVVVALGTYFCVRGSLTPGGFIAFISYNALLSQPVRNVGRIITQMSRTGIAIDRLCYVMNAEEENDNHKALTPPMDRSITFDHVAFSYENGNEEVLHDVSFTIPAGKTVGILGGTGSGKSTLMYLLDRLYELPEDQGSIEIGGVNVRDIDRTYLRKNIGIVLQEPYLFSRTLAENISIADEDADMDAVREASNIASLDEAVRRFSKGYETYVGERGVTLSGGQKQRAAIAQMLVKKPPVMIFDDSLSAVDAETDAKIREALKDKLSAATVILIAHRITTLMEADEIIVLSNGRVAEQGTHEELLKKNGIYRKVYDMQTAGLSAGEKTA